MNEDPGTDVNEHPPVLLDIFFDTAFRLDEREGRFAIAFRRHDDRRSTTCWWKIRDFFFFFSVDFYFFEPKTPQQMTGPPISFDSSFFVNNIYIKTALHCTHTHTETLFFKSKYPKNFNV
jgi:hypothetical protein